MSATETVFDRARRHIRDEWLSSGAYLKDRAAEAERRWREAPAREAVARMHETYMAKRAARAAAAATAPSPAAPPVMSGKGWRVSEHPKRPHAELQAFAEKAWDLAFHGAPFPEGYRVCWGDRRGLSACGLCKPELKLIVIDENQYHGNDRFNSWSFVRTVMHELVHAVHAGERDAHGPKFEATFQNVLDYMLPDPVPKPKPTPPPAAAPLRPADAERPTSPVISAGRPFTGRWGRDAEGWEYR